MNLTNPLKTDTMFHLLMTACELEANAAKVALQLKDTCPKHEDGGQDNTTIETAIYRYSIEARNGLNETYENYFLEVLAEFKDTKIQII